MKRIALKSKRPLFFPPAFKDVEIEMDIELIQNNPKTESYTLKIVDRAYKEVEETYFDYVEKESTEELAEGAVPEFEKVEKTRTVRKQVGKDIVRGLDKEYPYEMLNQLAQALNISFDDESVTTKNINDLFRQGFLVITNQECQSGEGLYGSEVGDWEFINE